MGPRDQQHQALCQMQILRATPEAELGTLRRGSEVCFQMSSRGVQDEGIWVYTCSGEWAVTFPFLEHFLHISEDKAKTRSQ